VGSWEYYLSVPCFECLRPYEEEIERLEGLLQAKKKALFEALAPPHLNKIIEIIMR
jgi:hypothetical protein